jgi:hypothetical protein
VTIAIPTFNRAGWLEGCVAAALAQTWGHFEVVVSDNASTDGTAAVLRQFRDSRLRVMTQATNIGLLHNWNACLAVARGEYVIFVSDDDIISPHALEEYTRLFEQEANLAIAIGLADVRLVDEDRIWRSPRSEQISTGINRGVDILKEYFSDRISIAMCTTMYSRERLLRAGGFPVDLKYAGDMASWLPILMEGTAGFVNKSCALFAVHADSETSHLDVDLRIADGRAILDLTDALAARCIESAQERRQLQAAGQLYFVKRVVGMLASARKRGARLRCIARHLWQWRRELATAGAANLFGLRRSLAVALLPAPILRWVKELVRPPPAPGTES